MAITANSTHLTFNDSTTQTTAINAAPGPTVVVFTSPGVYSRPPTIRGVVVTMVGGGAAGTTGYGAPNPLGVPGIGGSGGSGGGTTIRKWPLASLPPSIPVVVGVGGVATAPTQPGRIGSNSEFNVAPGVFGGSQYASGGGLASGDRDPGFGPGIGSEIYIEGGWGMQSPVGGVGPGAQAMAGSGGSSFFGGGGCGGIAGFFPSSSIPNPRSNPGKAWGSGGAGSPSANPYSGPVTTPGAPGANGIVIIEEFY